MQEVGILVGCDSTLECLLPWWWEHYQAHNTYPVLFADFGMTPQAHAWCAERGECLHLPRATLDEAIPEAQQTLWTHHYGQGIFPIRSAWFAKPLALLHSPFSLGLWIDIDCQINGPLEPLFHTMAFGAEMALVPEPAHIQVLLKTQGVLLPNETYYNSGVLLFRHNTPLLHQWIKEAAINNALYPTDQHALSRAIHLHRPDIIELPPIYNWICTEDPRRESLIHHY